MSMLNREAEANLDDFNCANDPVRSLKANAATSTRSHLKNQSQSDLLSTATEQPESVRPFNRMANFASDLHPCRIRVIQGSERRLGRYPLAGDLDVKTRSQKIVCRFAHTRHIAHSDSSAERMAIVP